MNFLYLDETGTDGKSAKMVIAGLCVDASRLNTATEKIENLHQSIRQCVKGSRSNNSSVSNVYAERMFCLPLQLKVTV